MNVVQIETLDSRNSTMGCVAIPWYFEFHILKFKTFWIDFLDELGNFKQKDFYTSKCNKM